MPCQRLLALFVAAALCATVTSAVAEQIGGQLQISLTIFKRCEVAVRNDVAVVHLAGRGCEHAAYQVRDADGRAVSLTSGADMLSVAAQSIEDAGSTLVIYW